jgi:hypothetical protein
MIEDYDLSTSEGRKEAAVAAAAHKEILEEAAEMLRGPSRKKRQQASSVLAFAAKEDAALVQPYADDVADALNRPEDQTRWNALNALDLMGKAGTSYADDVLEAAEDAMYDEDSGVLREAAFRFFCGYAASSPENSDKVWPRIDEAIQCYHGNQEFAQMLSALVNLAHSDEISDAALVGLATRMRFDAGSAKGTLGMRSRQIVEAMKARGLEFPEEPAAQEGDEGGDE